MTRRGFLGVLLAGGLASVSAARPGRWTTAPAGFTGGLCGGLCTRRVRVRA